MVLNAWLPSSVAFLGMIASHFLKDQGKRQGRKKAKQKEREGVEKGEVQGRIGRRSGGADEENKNTEQKKLECCQRAMMAVEKTQWIKCLSCKHEDLRSSSQNLHECWGCMTTTCNSRGESTERGDPQSKLGTLGSIERPCLRWRAIKEDVQCQPQTVLKMLTIQSNFPP